MGGVRYIDEKCVCIKELSLEMKKRLSREVDINETLECKVEWVIRDDGLLMTKKVYVLLGGNYGTIAFNNMEAFCKYFMIIERAKQ